MDIKSNWFFRIVFIGLIFSSLSCHRASSSVQSVSSDEALLTVLVEFRRYSEVDIYRFDIPQNLSGMNVFRVTLQRLDYYEQNHPGDNADIVAYTRAQAYARLGAFGLAIAEFDRVGSELSSALSQKARQRSGYFSSIESVVSKRSESISMQQYMESLDVEKASLQKILSMNVDDAQNYFILREIERVMVEKALLLFRNRFVVRNGALRGLDLMQEVIEQHASSRLIFRHHLMLGRFHYELAQDLVVSNPADGLQFEMALFEDLIKEARREFLLVAQADGYHEKFEAAALLDAIEAFERKVRLQSQ